MESQGLEAQGLEERDALSLPEVLLRSPMLSIAAPSPPPVMHAHAPMPHASIHMFPTQSKERRGRYGVPGSATSHQALLKLEPPPLQADDPEG